MFEILLIAAAGAAGYFFGRKSAPEGKGHAAMILLMAQATRRERKAVLDLPAVQIPKLPAGVPIPGLFTDDEKKSILQEVKAKQDELLAAGQTLSPEQRVTADEMDLKTPLPMTRPLSGIPVTYFFQ